MEKRSRRRTRDLVTQAASQGLSENEIGCARISMMARSTNAPCKGRIQMRKTNPSISSHSACNARPVHTVGSFSDFGTIPNDVRFTPDIVAKAFLRCRTKILRAADAVCVRRCEGPCRLIQNRSRTSVVALKGDAAKRVLKINLREIFRVVRFSTFATVSPRKQTSPRNRRHVRFVPEK